MREHVKSVTRQAVAVMVANFANDLADTRFFDADQPKFPQLVADGVVTIEEVVDWFKGALMRQIMEAL